MIKVGVVGGTGYTGVELLRLLARHPGVELTAITSRGEAGMAVSDMFPSLRRRVGLKFVTPQEARLEACDVVFFATPNGIAMQQAAQLVAAGVRVIEMGQLIAGPFCAKTLGDFGAEVIRVEKIEGSEDRWTSPVGADGTGAGASTETSARPT